MATENDTFKPMMSSDEGEAQVKFEDRTTASGKAKGGIIKTGKWLKKNLLLVLTISGVIAGLILGFALRTIEPSDKTIMLLSFPGDVLMRMLKMLIVPLVISCMVTGLASLDAKSSGKMGLRAVFYYFTTTFIAIVLGIVLVVSIRPGANGTKELECKKDNIPPTAEDAFLDLIRNIFPSNIIQAAFQHQRTVYVEKMDTCNKTSNTTGTVITRTFPMADGVNVLGIITFFTAFGIMLSTMGQKAKVMLDFFTVLNEIIMRMVMLVMWYSPIGIMFLIAGKILSLEDPDEVGKQLGLYMVTILLGLFIHTLIFLPGIYFVLTRKNPFRIMWGVVQAYVTALGTASSTATLPVTFKCLEENLNIDKRVTRFVLPIGATINMDGTALYEAVAPIFIAQMNGMELSFGKIITLSITATCASIGAAAMPSAGLVTMMMVLTTLDLPIEDISMIYAVDWFLDRFRTATNVLGDSFGAAVVEHLSRFELMENPSLAVTEVNMPDGDKQDQELKAIDDQL